MNPNLPYKEEYPLFLGIRKQDKQCIELLLNAKCDIGIKQKGKDCFEYCIGQEFYAIFLILLKRIPLNYQQRKYYSTIPSKSIFKAALDNNYDEFRKIQGDLIDSIETLNLKKFLKCI